MADTDDAQVAKELSMNDDDKMQVDPKPSGLQTIAEKKEGTF
jgi:hypothetical protein